MNVRISSKDDQSLAQENAALRNEVNILKEQLSLLQQQFDWLRKQVFGRKTEQTSVIMEGGTQLSLFPEEKEQAVSASEKTVTVPAHQHKAKRTHDDWMSSLPIKESVDPRDAMEVAHFLWERTWIIDDYLAGTALPEEQREIISDWKRCISGTFIIERHLKKGSMFISTEDNTVYIVNGIIDSWEEMLPAPTPVIVKTTLLPFWNVIISDGLMSAFPIRFGRNSAAEFKDSYMTAKKNKIIISRI